MAAKQAPKILPKVISDERRTALLSRLAFVRDINVEELGRILVFMNQKAGQYNSRDQLLDLLFKDFDQIGITRGGVPRQLSKETKEYFVYSNYPIAFTHLGLWDSDANLTPEGMKLAYHFRNKDDYSLRLAWLLLTHGKWLELLKVLKKTQDECRAKNIKPNQGDFKNELASKLFEGKFSISQEAMFRDLNDKLAWLEDLQISKGWDSKEFGYTIDWSRVIDALSVGSRL